MIYMSKKLQENSIIHKIEVKNKIIYDDLVFIDSEADIIKNNDFDEHKFKLGCAFHYVINNNKYIKHNEITTFSLKEFKQFIRNVISKNTNVMIIAHNMHYDFNLCNLIELVNEFDISIAVIDSNSFIISCEDLNGKKIVFNDSTNYVKVSLKSIGKSLGLDKLDIDFNEASDEYLSVYCRRDVEILSTFITNLYNKLLSDGYDNIPLTASSLSFYIFLNSFCKVTLYASRSNKLSQNEYQSYRGGRTECFRIGKFEDHFYKLDINSMYPYVMHNHPYPIKINSFNKKVSKLFIREFDTDKFSIVAKVRWITDKPDIALKKDGKLIFPVGKLEGYLTTYEVKSLIDDGRLVDISDITVYLNDYIFRDFINYFYDLKQKASMESDETNKQFAKLMLNSLYGKFGQRIRNTKIVKTNDSDESLTLEHNGNIIRKFGNFIIAEASDRRKSYNSIPAISSHVTANARLYLWRLIEKAGIENVYYCDTDSLFVNKFGYNNLKEYLDDFELGKLKVEGESDYLEIRGAKDYVFGIDEKIKGVKRGSRMISDNVFENISFMKTKTLAKNNYLDRVIVKHNVKILKREYDKGIVRNDGIVKPFNLEMW